jgi:Ca-activated chloride channel family protein
MTEAVRVPLISEAEGERRALGVLTVAREAQRAALPLARVEIRARVADRVAQVTLQETFRNPNPDPLEAVYIFPLSGSAAVADFELRVAGRVLRGAVEERSEARRQYRDALDAGRRAALLEQERDDVFTVQVGNLPPGEEATVRVTYSERLPFFEDGTTELRLPLVVAPRYVAGTLLDRDAAGDGVLVDTDLVPDASRISPPRLAPGLDPQVALSLEVELLREGGAEIGELGCSQHALRTASAPDRVVVTLARTDEHLDRDFVLRWRLAAEATRPALIVHRDDGRAYGMLSLIPPRPQGLPFVARDVVFVLDRSGSMSGLKMASAARACSILLATLGPNDRFTVLAFDDRVEWMPVDEGGPFVAASEGGIGRGGRFLRGIESRGGTELDAALGAALQALGARRDAVGRAPVVVLITDGQVGDESRALRRVQTELGDARVFTVGIDTAVSEGFLRRLAGLGGGTATFVEPGTALETALQAVGRDIGRPLVVDLAVEDVDAGLDAASTTPSRLPDLFAGRAATVFFTVKGPGRIRVRGRVADGGAFEETVSAREVTLPALGHLWARSRVADLEDRFRLDPSSREGVKAEIVALAKRHRLLTRFTAFVVVDEAEVVNTTGDRRRVVQPVHTPALWAEEEVDLKSTGAFSVMDAMPQLSMAAPLPMAALRPAVAPAPPVRQTKSAGGFIQDRLGAPARRLAEARERKRRRKEAAAEVDAVREALDAFSRALQTARDQIAAGRVPSTAALDEARRDLLKVVTASALGPHLVLLQRFLRASAVELVAAAAAPVAAPAALRELFERHARAFEEALAETRRVLDVEPERFWEETV